MPPASPKRQRSAVEPYDQNRALQGFGDAEIFRSAVAHFLLETDPMMESLLAAVERQDFAEVKEQAHRIKGGLVYLHAHPSAAAAKDLEQAAAKTDARAVTTCSERLVAEVERLKQSLRSGTRSFSEAEDEPEGRSAPS